MNKEDLTGSVTRGQADSAFALDPILENEWRENAKRRKLERNRPTRLKLPSGMSVDAIKAPMRWLYKHNLIPDHLSARVDAMIDMINASDPKAVAEKMESELAQDEQATFDKWLGLMNACWLSCVTHPLFSEDDEYEGATEPPFWIGDVDYFDKLYLYQWVEGVDLSVEEFLHQQSEIMGALQNGEGVRLSASGDIRVDRFGRLVAGNSGGQGDVSVGNVHSGQNRSTRRKARKQSEKTPNRTRSGVQTKANPSDDSR